MDRDLVFDWKKPKHLKIPECNEANKTLQENALREMFDRAAHPKTPGGDYSVVKVTPEMAADLCDTPRQPDAVEHHAGQDWLVYRKETDANDS